MNSSSTAMMQVNGDESDFLHLGQHLCEALHQLNLKRSALDDTRRDLHETYLVRHELERTLDRERRDAQKVRLQLELANTASRRWEEERGGVQETASSQRVQLEAALSERDMLKDQARELQLENMKLRRKTEEQEGQLRCQIAYQDGNISGQTKVRAIQEQINNELHKLEADHRRLTQTLEVAQTIASQALVSVKHRHCVEEQASRERKEFEGRLGKLAAEMDGMRLTSATIQNGCDKSSRNDELSTLREQVREMESRLTNEIDCNKTLSAAHDAALKQQTIFKKMEQEAQGKLTIEERRASELESNNSRLIGECLELKESLKTAEQSLYNERERAKKAECVERGVQCDSIELVNITNIRTNADEIKSNENLTEAKQ